MILFKIFQQFLLPSVFIPILILLGLIFILRKKFEKVGKILIAFGFLLYCLFSITPIADLILLPLENQFDQIQEINFQEADKIVLLLGGTKKRDDLKGASLLTESTLYRASEVLRIYFSKAKETQIIISGSDYFNLEDQEAEKVRKFLIEFGVKKNDIVLEDKSRNTEESAMAVKEIVEDKSFFLVTSAYHLPRSILIFRNNHLNPIPSPADFKRKDGYDILDFFPDPHNLRKTNLAFHEYLGIIYYIVSCK